MAGKVISFPVLTAVDQAVLAADAKMTARRFRVEADWSGGGFARTVQAENATSAWAWGRIKTVARPGATVTVTPRFPSTSCSQCGGEFGPGDAGYSHCDQHAASDLCADAEVVALIQGQGYVGGLPA